MLVLILVIFIFSVVQSIFGVGLLVFGTPTLLLLGKSFNEALSILLPCSLVISTCQVVTSKKVTQSFRRHFLILTLPMVSIGLILSLKLGLNFPLAKILGTILILTALIRFNKKIQAKMVLFFKRFSTFYLILLGLIHGLSNMGGGLLTIYSSTIVEGKGESRSIVSFAYWAFAILQLLILILMKKFIYNPTTLGLAIMSVLCFFFIGQKVFVRTSDRVYQRLITFFIFLYGVVLILK